MNFFEEMHNNMSQFLEVKESNGSVMAEVEKVNMPVVGSNNGDAGIEHFEQGIKDEIAIISKENNSGSGIDKEGNKYMIEWKDNGEIIAIGHD